MIEPESTPTLLPSRAKKNGNENDLPVVPLRNPSHIRNKMKRVQVMQQYRKSKKLNRKAQQTLRNRQQMEEFGKIIKEEPRTIDNTREPNVTMINAEDENENEEIYQDEIDDEFAAIFSNQTTPKIMITTRPFPSGELYHFINELLQLIPNSFYYKRGRFSIKEICQFAANKLFTHLIVLSERSKVCNGMLLSRLPSGPTSFFKVSNVKLQEAITDHGRRTEHQPEIILNNFSTRLGRRIGRFLGSCFRQQPEFDGRQVVTFHNQRDFIFIRHHRYIFDENGKRARLQEIGPSFTIKLKWLQDGTFDTKYGEYEWIARSYKQNTSRKRFYL
ncbi:hypothetical protein ABG067_004222 [Albugo candida]